MREYFIVSLMHAWKGSALFFMETSTVQSWKCSGRVIHALPGCCAESWCAHYPSLGPPHKAILALPISNVSGSVWELLSARLRLLFGMASVDEVMYRDTRYSGHLSSRTPHIPDTPIPGPTFRTPHIPDIPHSGRLLCITPNQRLVDSEFCLSGRFDYIWYR